MESRGVTKRARTDAVLKPLFLVCRITDWALQILMPKKPDRMQPFSVWPMADIPEEKVASDMESLGGFSMVRSEKEDPTPPPMPSYASQATEGANYVTAEDLALMGRPPTCAHQGRGNKAQTTDGCSGDVPWLEVSSAVTSHGHRCSPTGSFTGSPVTPTSQRSTAPKTPERARQEERTHYRTTKDEPWCGQTIFFRKTRVTDEVIKDKFTQQEKLASQGGYITFFYDSKMETEEAAYPITVICWKSFRIRRCTVNTLSAECQAMIQGV